MSKRGVLVRCVCTCVPESIPKVLILLTSFGWLCSRIIVHHPFFKEEKVYTIHIACFDMLQRNSSNLRFPEKNWQT